MINKLARWHNINQLTQVVKKKRSLIIKLNILCSMVNKIPETDIMAQTEDQRSKTVNLNLLTPPRMGDIVLHVTAD